MAGEDNNQEINLDGIDLSAFGGAAPESESINLEGIDLTGFADMESEPQNFTKVGALDLSSQDGDPFLKTRTSGAGKVRYGKPTEDISQSKSPSLLQGQKEEVGQLPKSALPEKKKNSDFLYNIVRDQALSGSSLFLNKNTREKYYDELSKRGYDRNAIKEIGDVGSAMAGQFQEMDARLKQDPMDHDALYKMGEIFLATRDYKRAKNSFTKILNEDPKNNMAAKQLGRTALIAKDYTQAAGIYKGLAEQFPDDPEVKEGLAAALYYGGQKEEARAIQAEPGQAPSQLEAQLGYEPRVLNDFGAPVPQASYTYDTPESDRMKGIVEGLSTFGKMSMPFTGAPDLIAPLLPSEQKQYDPVSGKYVGVKKDKGLVMEALESFANVQNPFYPVAEKPKELIKGLEYGAHSALSLMMLTGIGGQGAGNLSPSIGTAAKTYAWLYGPGAIRAVTGSDAIEKVAFEPISTISKPTVEFLRNHIPYLREAGFDLPEDEDTAVNHLIKLGDVMASLAIIGKGEKAVERLYKNAKYGTSSSRKQMLIQEIDKSINEAIDYGVTYDHVKNEIVPGSAQETTSYTPDGQKVLMAPGGERYRRYANQDGGYVFPAEAPLYPELPEEFTERLPVSKPPAPAGSAPAAELIESGVAEVADPTAVKEVTLDDIKGLDGDTPVNELPNGVAVEYNGKGGFISRDAETGEVLFNAEDGTVEIVTGGGDTKSAIDAGIVPSEGYYKDKHGEYYVRRKGEGYAVYKVGADGSLKRVYTGDKANAQRRDAIIEKALDPDRKSSRDYTQELREKAAQLEGDLQAVKGTPAEPAIAKKIEETQKKIAAMEEEESRLDSDRSQEKTVMAEIDNRINQLEQTLATDMSPEGKIIVEQEKVKLEQVKDEMSMRDMPEEVVVPEAEVTEVAPQEPKIVLSGLNQGFKAVSPDAFDFRQKVSSEVNNDKSFAKVIDVNGKKYVVVGLRLSYESQREAKTAGRDNYSFATAELNESTPADIVAKLEASARDNFKNVYPDFGPKDNIMPITVKGEGIAAIEGRAKAEPAKAQTVQPAKEEIMLAGLNQGFIAIKNNPFDLAAFAHNELMDAKSFAKVIERKGKKYVVVGLRLSYDTQRKMTGVDRDNYSFAAVELKDSTPSDIVQTLEAAARENFKNVYPDFSSKDKILPVTVKNEGIAEIEGRAKAEPVKAEAAKPELVTEEDARAQEAMDQAANRLVEIEGEFSRQGLKIESEYDNQIIVLDKNDNILEPEDLPENLRPLAGEYEAAVAKMGEYDPAMMERAMKKARGEEVPFEEVTMELPSGEEIGAVEKGEKKWTSSELGDKKAVDVMQELAKTRPSLKPLMDIAINIHNRLSEIRAKAGGDVVDQLSGVEKDRYQPFDTDLFPFPYRLYSQIFHSTRRTRFENIESALDTFKEKLAAAEKYLENPPSEQELAQKRQEVTDFYNKKIEGIKSEQEAARKRIEEARQTKQPVTDQEYPKVNEDYRSNKFFQAIVDKYKSAKALLGRKREIVIADGSKAKGQYKVVDANDIAPSHNPETYAKTKGVPVDEKGNTLNDRNYEADKQAQALNTERANNFNRKAIDNPIIVTEDGIVISGNDRTMARQKSAKQGTDRDYVDGLIADADMYGIDPAEVQRMVDEGKSPTLVFEKEGAPEYSTKEYAKYNVAETKGQNPLEKAVALSKKVDSKTTDRISALLDGISNSSDIVGKEVLANLRKVLVDDGVISKNDIPLYFDAEGKMTAAGKDFLENLVLATVFDEPTLRALDQPGVKSWRGKLANAKFDLMQNSRLGDYNIQDFIIDAVGLKKEQLDSGMPLFDWLTQTNMFREPVDPYTAMTMSLLEGSRNAFKDFVKSVNERAKTESVPDMFGEVSTPEQVMTKALRETTLKLDENEKNAIEKLFAVRNEANIRAAAEGAKSQPAEIIREAVEEPAVGGEAEGAAPALTERPVAEGPVTGEEPIKFARNTEEINKIKGELDDLLGDFGSTFEMGGLSQVDKLVPVVAKLVQLGYYKIADIAKYLVEKGLNAALPYLKDAYRTFKNTFNHDAEVKTSLSGEKEISDFGTERVAGGLEERSERAAGGRELPGQPGGEGARRRPPIRIANKENLPPIEKESVLDGQYDIDEVQRFGVNLAMQRFDKGGRGFLLADGAGVGKTREILVLANEMQKKTGKPSLIVTLKAVVDDSIKKDSKALGIDPSKLEIGTYDDLTAGKIGKGDYGVVIFDESHNLKNVQSERSSAASKIKRDHSVFASATPMDKPEHAVYFMSEVTGEDPAAIRNELGIEMVYVKGKEGEDVRSFARFVGGFDTYLARLIDKRNDIIKNGGMVRREYPFYGEINETSLPMPEPVRADIAKINEIYDKRYEDRENLVIGRWAGEMARTSGGNFLQNYSKIKKMIQGQGAMRDQYIARLREFAKNEGKARLESIDKIVEPGKVDHVFEETQKALAEGKKVVIVVGDVGEQTIKAGSEQKKDKYGFFEKKITDTLPVLLKKKFDEAGIKSAEIYGGNRRVGGVNKYTTEMERFNTGDADVVVMTAKSGGTGINLDDVVGNKPRKMIIATVDYQGDVFEQVIGRVSRRNTASPAEVVMPMMEGALSDTNRKTKVAKKVGLLAAINTGKADMDFERISTRHLMAEEPMMEAKPEMPDYSDAFRKATEPGVRMAERADMFETQFGENGEKAKHIYQNYQNILQRLKNASEKGELDITFEGDCI